MIWLRECHGLYNPWGPKELDMTEQLSLIMAKKNYFKNNQNVHQQGIVKINDIKIYNIIQLLRLRAIV